MILRTFTELFGFTAGLVTFWIFLCKFSPLLVLLLWRMAPFWSSARYNARSHDAGDWLCFDEKTVRLGFLSCQFIFLIAIFFWESVSVKICVYDSSLTPTEALQFTGYCQLIRMLHPGKAPFEFRCRQVFSLTCDVSYLPSKGVFQWVFYKCWNYHWYLRTS